MPSFPGPDFLRLPKNFGYTKAANIGIRGAKGDYVFLLPPTVEVAPDTIARLAARLDEDFELGAVCPTARSCVPAAVARATLCRMEGRRLSPGVIGTEDSQPLAAGYVRDTALLVRRTFLAGMHFLDQRYGEFGAQLDLCHQLRNAGKKLAVLPDVRVQLNPLPPAQTGNVEIVDHLNGMAAFAGKYHGFGSSFKIRFGAALSSLFSFRFGVLSGIAGRPEDRRRPTRSVEPEVLSS